MNIGLVTPYYPDSNTTDSGLANHFFSLATALSDMGHKVIVLHVRPIYENENSLNFIETQNNVTHIVEKINVPPILKYFLKKHWTYEDFYKKVIAIVLTYFKLKKLVKIYNIEVIETSTYFSLCYLYMRLGPIPVISRVSTTYKQMYNDHYTFKSRLSNLIAAIEGHMIRKSKYLLTHSKNHLNEIKKIHPINTTNISIIPHGVNLPLIKTQHTQASSTSLNVLFVGRFESRKGIDILLAAIPIVLAAFPDVIFTLVGNNFENYQHDFQKTNISPEKVCFLGKVSNSHLQELYHNCDIFVAPSRYESFGIIYIEAMSYGKPVIGCKVGGVTDVIIDHVNGLFSTIDEIDLADKILLLLKNPVLRKTLGTNARQIVANNYTKEIIAKNSLSYYQEIINLNNA